MALDACYCPTCEGKLKTVQGAPFIFEGHLLYWRRKKCLTCSYMLKTVEVPSSSLNKFHQIPDSKDMS